MELTKINDMMRSPAREIFAGSDPDHVLQQAICSGLQYYDEPQFIVIDENNALKAVDASTLPGNLTVMVITFTKQETVDFLSKVAPDLVPEIDNPAFKSFLSPWTLKGGERVTKYPEVESVSYVGLQDILMRNLEHIAESWYTKLTK
ncbi:hypothetical protein [Acidaminococcus massiliensis]